MLEFVYPAKCTRDRKDGGYVVTFRDLPETITQADTIAHGWACDPGPVPCEAGRAPGFGARCRQP